MEKRERKPGYFARLKRRRQLKQSQSEKGLTEQHPSDSPIISCPDTPDADPTASSEADLQKKNPNPPEGSEDLCNTNSQSKREKKRPPGTVEYTVGPQDTLNIIALKFNITPNKLVQINRLFSRSVYPGQKLFVPDAGQLDADSQSKGSHDPTTTNGQPEIGSHNGDSGVQSTRPLRREMSSPSEDESPATVKFIKMSCKYFTDGMGVVGGVMIVTPNNIMFDPHKSDPLVIEHGCEEYGLICPMDEVVSVALYDDVSRMKLKDALPSDLPQDLCPLYRPGEWEELPSEQDINPFSRYEALDPKRTIVLDDIDSALSETVTETTEKSPSDEGFTELELPANGNMEEVKSAVKPHCGSTGKDQQGELSDSQPQQRESSSDPVQTACPKQRGEEEEEEDEGLVQNNSIENTTDSLPLLSEADQHGDMDIGKPEEKLASLALTEAKDVETEANKALVNGVSDSVSVSTESKVDQNRKLSLSETGRGSNNCSPHEDIPAEQLEKRPTADERLSEEEKRKKSYEAEVKSWLMERMQAPIEDMLLSSEEKSKTPPMFLCFKVGKPMRKSFAVGRTSSPVHAYGSREKQPEYWFAVPQERVDHLYAFFVQWSPDVYGKEAREQGFVVVEKDELNMIDNFFSDPVPRNWEIITINEAKRRQSFSYDGGEPVDLLPMLSDPSALLQDTHIEKLACRLPARVQGYPWRLAYSTVEHGTSLKTLYRSLAEVDSPVLLVVKDMDSQVFGAFSTHPFRLSEHCYGTGETFLYSFCPEIKVYRWTGENSYFVKGNTDSLQMGGGGGQLGLWLDADLYHGTTSPCATFNNQPLSTHKDFTIHSLEVWAFE